MAEGSGAGFSGDHADLVNVTSGQHHKPKNNLYSIPWWSLNTIDTSSGTVNLYNKRMILDVAGSSSSKQHASVVSSSYQVDTSTSDKLTFEMENVSLGSLYGVLKFGLTTTSSFSGSPNFYTQIRGDDTMYVYVGGSNNVLSLPSGFANDVVKITFDWNGSDTLTVTAENSSGSTESVSVTSSSDYVQDGHYIQNAVQDISSSNSGAAHADVKGVIE